MRLADRLGPIRLHPAARPTASFWHVVLRVALALAAILLIEKAAGAGLDAMAFF